MEFRKAVHNDIDTILNIIQEAQVFLKENGVNQWQDNYPNFEVIKDDIDNGESYVLLKDDRIIATVAVSFRGEETYNKIYHGQWLSNGEYAVIHRIAVSSDFRGKGVASEIIKKVEKLCTYKGVYSIKIDTHKNNLIMQKLIKKNSFKYCGIIFLKDGNKRLAFEKILPKQQKDLS